MKQVVPAAAGYTMLFPEAGPNWPDDPLDLRIGKAPIVAWMVCASAPGGCLSLNDWYFDAYPIALESPLIGQRADLVVQTPKGDYYLPGVRWFGSPHDILVYWQERRRKET